MSALLEALPVPVYTTDADGFITFYNEAAAELWGTRPTIGDTRWCGAWRLFLPDGSPMTNDQSALAVALRERRSLRREQAILERPDGVRVPFLAFPTPIYDATGALHGAVSTLLDISAERSADDVGMRLAAIVESSMDAIISKDLNGIITSWNAAAERLFGYTAQEAIGKPVLMLIPEGNRDEETSIIQRIRRGERVTTYETIRQRKDGSLVPVSLTVSPVRDGTGRIVGASKIVRDISNRKDNEQRIRMLMREVNHRVKNQYAVILSMIRETGKRSRNPADFERQVRERIMALSESHDLLVSADWKGATVFELLKAQVKPFGHEERISLSGPLLTLRPSAVQYLGIAFHELATNSAKYGALSGHGGKISIVWEIDTGADGSQRFLLTWTESGYSPSIAESVGFGTVVLERVAPQAMNGVASLEYRPQGLSWRLEAPVSAVEARLGEA